MERFVKGDIVVTHFPFSDLTSTIKRPALVIANTEGNDAILCEITSKNRPDRDKILLSPKDLKLGNLKINSFIRPSRIFTLSKSLLIYRFGCLKDMKIKETEEKLCEIFKR